MISVRTTAASVNLKCLATSPIHISVPKQEEYFSSAVPGYCLPWRHMPAEGHIVCTHIPSNIQHIVIHTAIFILNWQRGCFHRSGNNRIRGAHEEIKLRDIFRELYLVIT